MAYTLLTQELFDQFPNGLPHDQFQNFEAFAQFNPQPTAFAGPPTPPTQQLPPTAQPINGALHLQHQQQPTADLLQSLNNGQGETADEARARRQGSNSDEDENLTPAQSRRKAQNRAAYVTHRFSYYIVGCTFSGILGQTGRGTLESRGLTSYAQSCPTLPLFLLSLSPIGWGPTAHPKKQF